MTNEEQTVRPVPHGATRWARDGETCTCGDPAVVVYETKDHGAVGYCGRQKRW